MRAPPPSARVARQIVARYQAGETMLLLRREYHMGYPRFCTLLEAFGVERRGKIRKRKDTQIQCLRCEIVLEECEDWERAMERDGLCGDCARFEDMGKHIYTLKDYGEGR